MAWWSPKSWFQKATPPPPSLDPAEIVARWQPATTGLVAPDGPFVWVLADPEFPHAGLSSFTNEIIPPLGRAFCVTGITPEKANGELMGRVVAWERLTTNQIAAFAGPPFGFALHIDEFRRMLR